jgi:hypothetical protein
MHPAEGKLGPVQVGTLACGNTRVPQTAMLASAVLPGPPHGWAKDEKEISNKKANVKRRIGSLLCIKNKQNIALFPGFTGGWLITCYQTRLFGRNYECNWLKEIGFYGTAMPLLRYLMIRKKLKVKTKKEAR